MKRKNLLRNVIAFVMIGLFTIVPQTPALAVGERYGPYLLTTIVNGIPLCLDNPASTSNGTVMTISHCHGDSNQLWTNEKRDSYSYWTFSKYGGKCLTVKNASRVNSADIIQYTCNDGANERWLYLPVYTAGTTYTMTLSNGKKFTSTKVFQIQNVNSSRCITVKNASHFSGNTLLQYDCSSPGLNAWVQYPAG